jgi:hypothetical protein
MAVILILQIKPQKSCSMKTSYLPTAPKPVRYRNEELRVLLEISSGLRDYCFALIRIKALSGGKLVNARFNDW